MLRIGGHSWNLIKKTILSRDYLSSLYCSNKSMGNDSPQKISNEEGEQQPTGFSLETVITQTLPKRTENRPQYSHIPQQVQNCLKDITKDRALGCLFGALIGDSLGSFCQFSNTISDRLINQVMKMPGGGVFDLKPGQVTDDSELASHLLAGLNQIDINAPLNTQYYTLLRAIASGYVTWLKSDPFDVGITCNKGITHLSIYTEKLKELSQEEMKPLFDKIFQGIDLENKDSESNGSLMRITPMAILFACSKMKVEEHEQFIKNEVKLIHSKNVTQQASYLWVHVLTQLIMRPDDSNTTFKSIFESTQHLDKDKLLEKWFAQSKKEDKMPGTVRIGWAKIAWTYSMQELHRLGSVSGLEFNQNYFKEKVREAIKEGGDTDTNGCIIGGMLGAIVGFSNLPPWYLHKLFSMQLKEAGVFISSENRPVRYQPFRILIEAVDFMKKCEKYSTENVNVNNNES